MSTAAINVEGLGKRYLIRHLLQQRAGQQHHYVALRDVLAEKARGLFRTRNAECGTRNSTEAFWALKDVSFEVKQGERVGIIGRNGAGKSTLLKILSRITEPTTGRVRIKGRVASLLEVGTGFHPELTGRENIFLNGAVLGMMRGEIRKKFDEIVAFADVEKFLDTPVKRYSSGMYVRLAFAVAAHLEPEILVVDEVLAVGDAEFQKKCLAKMEDVGQTGRSILFVSHNMPSVTRLCERAILLDKGSILANGPATEVVGRYLSSDLGTTAVREWNDRQTAPGNEFVKLRAARVYDGTTHQVSDSVEIQHPVEIEIDYENLSNDCFPCACFQLFDSTGTCLFASGDFTNREWRRRSRKFTGNVRSTCIIPANFLSEGPVRVLIALTTYNPTEVLALEKDAISFVVVDHTEGDGARGESVGYFPGVVRPLLDWKVEITS